MVPSTLENAFDPWAALATYRERYDIEDRLGVLHSLEKSIGRRRAKLHSLQRRAEWLAAELEETSRLIGLVKDEISGSLQTGGLLIGEVLDQIRIEVGEAWSPVPMTGYRIWIIEDNSLKGAKLSWRKPFLSAGCLGNTSGEDIPHSEGRCGKPACGIYATKKLEQFRELFEDSLFDGNAVGVVALSGKVVEHEEGYRAQHGRAVAVVAQHEGRHLATASASEIEHLFGNPSEALAVYGSTGELDTEEAEMLLANWKEKEQAWT